MMASYVLSPNVSPLREYIVCERDGVADVCFNQVPSRVVVGPVPIFLKLLKSCADIHKVLFKGSWVSLILRRESSVAHRPVIEHPT